MDSDVAYEEGIYTGLQSKGIAVFRWQNGYSTEAALFSSVPSFCVPALLDIAVEWKPFTSSVISAITIVVGGP